MQKDKRDRFDLVYIMEPLSLPMIILYAVLYGITMKIADLLNEHGLKLFRGSDLLFGILWGVFGVLLLFSDNHVANIMLAMNIAFIVRNRLDYNNHRIAASLIIIGFLFHGIFEAETFVAFYLVFLVFGSLKDYVNDKVKERKGLVYQLNGAMLYYPAATFIFSSITGDWTGFYIFLVYTVTYNVTKYIGRRRGYH